MSGIISALMLLAGLLLQWLGISAMVVVNSTPKGFLKTEYDIEMAMWRCMPKIKFWLNVVTWTDLVILVTILHYKGLI